MILKAISDKKGASVLLNLEEIHALIEALLRQREWLSLPDGTGRWYWPNETVRRIHHDLLKFVNS